MPRIDPPTPKAGKRKPRPAGPSHDHSPPTTRATPKKQTITITDSEDDTPRSRATVEVVIWTPRKTTKINNEENIERSLPTPVSTSTQGIFLPEPDDSALETSPRPARQKRNDKPGESQPRKKRKKVPASAFGHESESADSVTITGTNRLSSSDKAGPSTGKRRKIHKHVERSAKVTAPTRRSTEDSLTDSDDDQGVTHSRRRPRLQRGRRPIAQSSSRDKGDQERADLEEDVQVLKSSQITPSRTRDRTKLKPTKAQKLLQELKRRRQGEPPSSQHGASESSSDEPRRGLYDTEPSEGEASDVALGEPEADGRADGERDDDEDYDKATALWNVKKSLRGGRDKDYEADFVVSDDEIIGVPTLDIPLELTSRAHKPLKDHFRYVVEWMVHSKLNPGFQRDDPVYQAAFRKLENRLEGYRDSHFTSSTWSAPFLRALKSRPEMYESSCEPREDQNCEACRRTNHPASSKIQFGGKVYDKESLEDEEDEDSDDDSGTVDSNGNSIPPVETVYYLGRFCADKARNVHNLTHWKHALFATVNQDLESKGLFTAKQIVKRDRMSRTRRTEFADQVVMELEEEGQIRALWQLFKGTLHASEAHASRKPNRWKP